MLYFLIALVILFALCDRASRHSRIELLLLNSRFKLFKIRDELRRNAIRGQLETNKWFDYLDTSLTKTIDQLPKLTIWQAFILFVHYKDDEQILNAERELMKALDEEGNEKLSELYSNYLLSVAEFIFTRHRSMRLSFKVLAKATGGLMKLKNEMAKIISAAPETSTLLKYC